MPTEKNINCKEPHSESNRITCPVCGKDIEDGEVAVACLACGLVYHEDCWYKNKGCVRRGCPRSSPYQVQTMRLSDKAVCKNCGMTLSDEHKYCHKCGTPKDSTKTGKCVHCGADLLDWFDFCPKCGAKR